MDNINISPQEAGNVQVFSAMYFTSGHSDISGAFI